MIENLLNEIIKAKFGILSIVTNFKRNVVMDN